MRAGGQITLVLPYFEHDDFQVMRNHQLQLTPGKDLLTFFVFVQPLQSELFFNNDSESHQVLHGSSADGSGASS